MNKAIQNFKANPNKVTALKVVSFAEKQPMAACIYGAEIEQAWTIVKGGN